MYVIYMLCAHKQTMHCDVFVRKVPDLSAKCAKSRNADARQTIRMRFFSTLQVHNSIYYPPTWFKKLSAEKLARHWVAFRPGGFRKPASATRTVAPPRRTDRLVEAAEAIDA